MMRFFSRQSLVLGIALIALFSAVCYAQSGGPAPWTANANTQGLFVKSSSVDKQASQSILLIGENHANVKNQVQLAEFLQRLLRDRSVDAILVEGSNGKIDSSELRSSLAKFGDSTGRFWKGQLDLGQIAGYEYVGLTQNVRIWGVEDMDAKRRYSVGAARRSIEASLQRQIDLHTRALAIARNSIATVDAGRRRTSGTDAVLTQYESKIAEFRASVQKSGSQYGSASSAYQDTVEKLTALFLKAQPVLPAYEAWAREAERYNEAVQAAKNLVAQKSTRLGVNTDRLLAQIKAAQASEQAASSALDAAAKRAGYANGDAFRADLKQLADSDTAIKTSEDQLTRLQKAFSQSEKDLTNQFFLAANAVRNVIGKPVLRLQTYLRDEERKILQDPNDPEKVYLGERDKFMVANTLAYLRANTAAKNIVLIVGYAHVDGVVKRMASENVNVVAGKMAASEEPTEVWENRAWSRRSRPTERVFSSSMKELSRLLDLIYKAEIPALVDKLQVLNTNSAGGITVGRTKILELSGAAGRKVIVTTQAGDLRANWGSQVLQMGTAPDGKGTPFLVIDRDHAQNQAKALSGTNAVFATMYRTSGPQGAVTKLDTPTGTLLLEDFKKAIPRSGQKVPKRVVISAEGDENAMNTALASGGSGGAKPPWTSRRALFAELPDNNRPSLVFTKNMSVANERLLAIEKQEPLKMGQIATIQIGLGDAQKAQSLNDLWFTPENGAHARVYLIVGENTAQFRARLKEAAEAGLLRNKQIALATCFDEAESGALANLLLDAGALMVWSPQKRISPQAAQKLQAYMEKVDAASGPIPPRGLDEYIDRALQLWSKDNAGEPDLQQFLDSTNRANLDASNTQVSAE